MRACLHNNTHTDRRAMRVHAQQHTHTDERSEYMHSNSYTPSHARLWNACITTHSYSHTRFARVYLYNDTPTKTHTHKHEMTQQNSFYMKNTQLIQNVAASANLKQGLARCSRWSGLVRYSRWGGLSGGVHSGVCSEKLCGGGEAEFVDSLFHRRPNNNVVK